MNEPTPAPGSATEGARSDAPSAAAGALRTVIDLSRVRGPQDLPPSLAEELGEIVATHVGDWKSVFLRDGLKAFGMVGAFGLMALLTGLPMLRWAFFGAAISLPFTAVQLKRQAPLLMAGEHLKQLGVGWNARRMIVKKLRQIVGTFPATRTEDRPGAGEIAALLDPQGEEMGRQAALPAAPHADRLEQLPERTARVVVDQRLVFKRRLRGVGVLLGIIYLVVLGPLLSKVSIGFILGLGAALAVQMALSLALSIPLIHRQLRAPLVAVGLGKGDAKAGLKTLFAAEKTVRRRLKAAGDKLERPAFIGAVVEQWRADLGAVSALPEGDGDELAVPEAPAPAMADADKASKR